MSMSSAAASPSTDASTTATWDDCVGPAKWLNEPLQRILSYPSPLPVQQAVIPTITRALMSGVPNDVSLTAPTGSGKTLCYLVPLLRLLTETKKGVDDNALRCLILVPSQSLGQQVHRELQRLTRPTSIRVACVCAEVAPVASASETDMAEASLLVRRVTLPRTSASARARDATGYDPSGQACATESDEEDGETDNGEEGEEEEEGFGEALSAYPTRLRDHHTTRVRYFSNADVIVATPERLLHHLDHTRGLRLADLRLFVIDEADQVLVGNFASQVQKVNARYEYEVRKQQQKQQRQQQYASAALTTRMAMATGATPSPLRLHSSHHSISTAAPSSSLHKVLCSATLSSRIARIAQVKLRNCSYYVLDSNGAERNEEAMVASAAPTESTSKKKNKNNNNKAAAAGSMTVRTQFALPPTLQEHVIFVEDSYRPAVLLKLVHALRERISAVLKQSRTKAARRAAVEGGEMEDEAREEKNDKVDGSTASPSPSAPSMDYPSVEAKAGTGILIFCATAEEARVMSHFLAAAGVTSVVEFTTLASEAERRRALLQRPSTADEVSCVVASDALMRGIDIPNVGHVIMYHPPDAVSQYVHRAGRTARAMRPGHVHLLLSKTGSSGTLEDGEVALYKRLSQSLSRTLPVSYERLFFRFAENPARPAATGDVKSAGGSTANAGSVAKTKSVAGSAEWWVGQAEQFLIQSQHQLQRRWASVLESAAAVAAAKATKAAPVAAAGMKGGETRKPAVPPSSAAASSTAASAARKRARPESAKASAAK